MQISLSDTRRKTEPVSRDASSRDIKNYLYGKVSFRTENYISSILTSQDILLKNEKFDTIVCLKTTKYVHLNFGD